MKTASHCIDQPVEVSVLNRAQWKAAAESALADLKLTYDELAEQARRRDFVSSEARKVWLAIGGKRP